MKADIRLVYGRVGELCDGKIWSQVYPTRGMMLVLEFKGFTFPRMMSRLAETIREYDEVTVMLSRTEITGSNYRLDEATINLLKTDPAAAISQMMPESRLIVIRDEMRPSTRPPLGLLRAGHDTIAASFGDHLYCEVDSQGRVECPGCGRWTQVTSTQLQCMNKRCSIHIKGEVSGSTWFIVATQDVLSMNLPRYYFPRTWNPKGGWITHEALQHLFTTFQEERSACTQESVRKE